MTATALLATGLAMLGSAPSILLYLAGWLVIGLGMSAGLYDACFSTLARIYGENARKAIISLTLWGGFSSTVCWPLSSYLADSFGWRTACFAYAGVLLLFCLPLLFYVPTVEEALPLAHVNRRPSSPAPLKMMLIVAALFSTAAAINGILAVSLISLLLALGHDAGSAVFIGMLVGPAQFGVRLLLTLGGARLHAVWITSASIGCVAIALCWMTVGLPLTFIAVAIYGVGNGAFWIARGTLPLALFDPTTYASVTGWLAFTSFIAQAFAPALGVLVLAAGGEQLLMVMLSLLAGCSVILCALLVASRRQA